MVEVEQAFGYQEGDQDLAQRRSFFLGQVERDAGAEPIDEPVGGLGADNVMAQPMGADRLGMGLAHRFGERFEQLRL